MLLITQRINNRKCLTFGFVIITLTFCAPLFYLHKFKQELYSYFDDPIINGLKTNKEKFYILVQNENNSITDKNGLESISSTGLFVRANSSKAATNSPQIIKKLLQIVLWVPPKDFKRRQKEKTQFSINMNKVNCFQGCNVKLGDKQEDVDNADAVEFFTFRNGYSLKELPKRKNTDQIWIYRQHEPPPHYFPGEHLNDLFNWTMTYRKDSDIYSPYVKIIVGNNNNDDLIKNNNRPITFNGKNLEKWIFGKSAFGVAVISNCNTTSKRLQILNRLKSEGLKIDIYGQCGNKTGICIQHNSACDKEFWNRLAKKYKFFFAFENSLCTDYATEKLGRTLEIGMVPVVLGRVTYSEVVPPNSVIDIRDFPNPNDLKDYLIMLDSNAKEYAKFFEWRKRYSLATNFDDGLCELCEKLKDFKNKYRQFLGHPMHHKQLSNLTGWWATNSDRIGSACVSPLEMGLEKYLQ